VHHQFFAAYADQERLALDRERQVTPEYAAVANYGYHLDAGKFGVFLRKHCVLRLGVRHVLDHVVAIKPHDNGDIATERRSVLELARLTGYRLRPGRPTPRTVTFDPSPIERSIDTSLIRCSDSARPRRARSTCPATKSTPSLRWPSRWPTATSGPA
jgi:hypothetical protein